MQTVPELPLSLTFRLAQRAYAILLDRFELAPVDVFSTRAALRVVDRADRARLTRWLAWQTTTRNPQALARIERVDARLAAQVLHARASLPAIGGAARPAPLKRTA